MSAIRYRCRGCENFIEDEDAHDPGCPFAAPDPEPDFWSQADRGDTYCDYCSTKLVFDEWAERLVCPSCETRGGGRQ